MMNLESYLKKLPDLAIAFSGGVDSAYLLYAASRSGIRIGAYYASSVFQPEFEKRDAVRLAEELGVSLTIIDIDVLSNAQVAANPADRCYYCKRAIFGTILSKAREDGFSVLADGTNFSDEVSDRPGMRALQEMKVVSPLRICGLTKQEIRELSRKAGLFTADKPSYACLATRIPTGTVITREALERTEAGEDILFSLGFTDFRIRMMDRAAKIQLPGNQMEKAVALRQLILEKLAPYYDDILLDLKGRN